MDQGHATTTMSDTPAAAAEKKPLRRDAERNRLLILRAARTVFAQRGLEASLDEVAREAGLGVGTVYRRFPNRDALIDALFADGINTINRIVDESLEKPRAWDGLRHFMSSMLELQCQDKGLRDVMVAKKPPETTQEMMRNRIKPPISHLVHRAQQQGDLREDLIDTDIGVLEIAAIGAAEFTAPAAPDVWRRYLTIMMDGMRARPTGDSGNTPLQPPPIDDDQIDACMDGWKYGTRETKRDQRKHPHE
jgi:AcrR family transcriptional regulator